MTIVSMLLDDGPHIAVVYPEETVTDSHGNTIKRPAATGTTIRCIITPISSRRDKEDLHRRPAVTPLRHSGRDRVRG